MKNKDLGKGFGRKNLSTMTHSLAHLSRVLLLSAEARSGSFILGGQMRTLLIATLLVFMYGSAVAGELKASWYSNASLIKEGTWKNGKECRMANGRKFDENALTCAARLYPLGSVIRVTDVRTNKSVIVTVTDKIGKRFAASRIDLTRAAFLRLAPLSRGVLTVKVEVVK
jgi:rare lipoprotein A (peptidoglycan hydrolase)